MGPVWPSSAPCSRAATTTRRPWPGRVPERSRRRSRIPRRYAHTRVEVADVRGRRRRRTRGSRRSSGRMAAGSRARRAVRARVRRDEEDVEREVVLGTGDHRYRLRADGRGCRTVPPFGIVCGVAVDAEDRVYVYARGERPVTMFAPDGAYLGRGVQRLVLDAHGIHVGPDEAVYLTDRDAHEVLKCRRTARVLMRLGTRGEPSMASALQPPRRPSRSRRMATSTSATAMRTPGCTASTRQGPSWVSWGRPGSGPGEFRTPHDVCVARATASSSAIATTPACKCSTAPERSSRPGPTSSAPRRSPRTARASST